jgi:hypothetical protein
VLNIRSRVSLGQLKIIYAYTCIRLDCPCSLNLIQHESSQGFSTKVQYTTSDPIGKTDAKTILDISM